MTALILPRRRQLAGFVVGFVRMAVEELRTLEPRRDRLPPKLQFSEAWSHGPDDAGWESYG